LERIHRRRDHLWPENSGCDPAAAMTSPARTWHFEGPGVWDTADAFRSLAPIR
jgi:hypothetical protein